MQKFLKILEKCALFDQIAPENLTALLGCLGAKTASFEKSFTVMAEGTPAHYIGIVLSGSVQLVQVDFYGNRSIIAHAEQGDLFAEAFACAGIPRIPLRIIADTDCEILYIDSRRIVSACSNACSFHQQIIFNLMKTLANKNILFHQKIEITSKRTTREKLMAYLMVQAKKHGSNRFTIPFDRQALADYLEVDRSGLSAEISKLRKEGVLLSDKKQFELL
ncbi:MAG: Crp/Fnr family transcriptional regulator [Clostridia bacterium]|nr:Crp/Fnr family transcriptional regulator [Clostridia bacterium]